MPSFSKVSKPFGANYKIIDLLKLKLRIDHKKSILIFIYFVIIKYENVHGLDSAVGSAWVS